MHNDRQIFILHFIRRSERNKMTIDDAHQSIAQFDFDRVFFAAFKPPKSRFERRMKSTQP
jgi:hypothetical protein